MRAKPSAPRRAWPRAAVSRHHPRKRVIQYSRDGGDQPGSRGVLDAPLSRGMTPVAELQLRCSARQQLPVVALLLPVHQDGEILWGLLAVGKFLLADEVETHDRGRADNPDCRILVFERRPL